MVRILSFTAEGTGSPPDWGSQEKVFVKPGKVKEEDSPLESSEGGMALPAL